VRERQRGESLSSALFNNILLFCPFNFAAMLCCLLDNGGSGGGHHIKSSV